MNNTNSKPMDISGQQKLEKILAYIWYIPQLERTVSK
jgi:hypothetical protein